ncbi:hypothetical protein Rhal01_02990 [Rubritalea halochordaticola]|uniref:Tetracyclin repressor-like C-terminal domain-containing protein n=1 Tax=Rubritalea halochordaticola TaxID=714537 RepID=A0ABP9V492_9BACT
METLKPLYSDEKKCETVAWSFFTLFQGAQIVAKQPGARESLLQGIELFIDGLG